MDAIILMDADSQVFSSCLTKADNTKDGKGFLYDLDTAKSKFEEGVFKIINTIEDTYQFNIIHTVIFIEGHGNFRYSIRSDYKANRKDRELPPLINHLKEWIIKSYSADSGLPFSVFSSVNVETDDSIAATYKKYKFNDYGIQMIISSPDKDIKTIPSLIFDSYWSKMDLHSIDEFTAHYNLMKQMIVGDNADGVKGIPKIGEKGAEKALKNCKSKIQLTGAVWDLYKKNFPKRGRLEFFKNYHILKLNDVNLATPYIDELIF